MRRYFLPIHPRPLREFSSLLALGSLHEPIGLPSIHQVQSLPQGGQGVMLVWTTIASSSRVACFLLTSFSTLQPSHHPAQPAACRAPGTVVSPSAPPAKPRPEAAAHASEGP